VSSPSPLVLAVAGAGVVFVWSATHGANVTQTIRDLLGGRAPVAGADPALVQLAPDGTGPVGSAIADAQAPAASGIGTAAGVNRANGRLQAAGYGWIGAQWTALDKLWTRESGWNNRAQNPTSTAYGIAQFLDGTWAGYGPKTSDPTLQIRYGLAYIRHRYGTPVAAWAHETSAGWY
jgi:hypothetical protein